MNPVDTKIELIRKGWTQRRAAHVLNVHNVHLCAVCNGRIISRSLTRRIYGLPLYSVWLARQQTRELLNTK